MEPWPLEGHAADRWLIEFDDETAGPVVGVAVLSGGVVHRPRRHPARETGLDDLGDGVLPCPGLDQRVDFALAGLPASEHGEFVGHRPVGRAHHLSEGPPLGVVTGADRDPRIVVLAGEESPGGASIGMVSPWLHRARFEGLLRQQIGHHVDDLLDLTHLDMEPGIAVEATAEYTGEGGDRTGTSGEVVWEDRHRSGRLRGRLVVPQVRHATGDLGVGAVARPGCPRPSAAHQLARHHHEAVVLRRQVAVADAHLLHDPGRVVLDGDVADGGHALEQGAALGVLGVDTQAPLAPTRRCERRRHLTAEHRADEVGIRP